jgi:hypothetical protein
MAGKLTGRDEVTVDHRRYSAGFVEVHLDGDPEGTNELLHRTDLTITEPAPRARRSAGSRAARGG